jgi:hypothetical protein
MFTRNIKDTFTANLLNAVSGVLGEAKKCKDCGCAKCTCDDAEDQPEETKEGYMPTNDMPSDKDRKTAGKLGNLLKRERDAKEKKEPNGVKTEAADMPFEKPYKKVGERKDEYGNKVKNVAKHLAKKAMKANEEVEDLDEKRGLWDNIHAKRKRIKAGSGEKMRKPGSEGAPSAADLKASQKEEVSLDNAFEQIDEISKATMGRYINKAKDSIDIVSYRQGHKEAHGSSAAGAEKKLTKRHKGIETAVKKLTKEEQDFVDSLNNEIFEKTDPYDIAGMIKKAKAKNDPNHPAMKHVAAIEDIKKHGGALSVQGDHVRSLIKALGEDANVGQIDEISKGAALKYLAANKKDDAKARETGDYDRMTKRMRGTDMAVRKYTAKPSSKYVRVPATEEVEIAEALGRPRKAGAKDFTIHPKTKEKLMHNNPADMARIERLQKNGILQKPKTEANQHVIQQLQRAKLSMRGGETVNFTHGDPTHVSGTHASKLLDKYAGMKPDEKEAFQKKIGHSHANLKSEL